MSYQETSALAYASVKKNLPKLGQVQHQVFECISKFPTGINNRMISEETKIPINVVTPRVTELREKGLVCLADKEVDPVTNRLTMLWKSTIKESRRKR